MIENFLKLFLNEEGNLGSLFLILCLSYANAGLFMWDLYQLVKKKNSWETMSVMLLPFAVSLLGGVMLAIFVHIPATTRLNEFAKALDSRQLAWELASVVLLYWIVWSAVFMYQRFRKRNLKKWILSCVPDFIYVLLVIVFPVCYLTTGKNLFYALGEISGKIGFGFNVFLYIYLYAFFLLSCKIILFVIGLIVCFYSKKITGYRYKENKNPVTFFLIYELICQNALLRGMLMFWVPLLILLTVLVIGDGAFWDVWFAYVLFLGGGAFCVFLIIKPVVTTYERFKQWGDRKRLIELFCREYFIEPHVVSGRDYVITRHFLIDEQSPAGIYYWEKLSGWTKGFVSSKNGWVKQLCFKDGQVLELVKGEEQIQEVFDYAAMYEESRRLKARREEFNKKERQEEDSLYTKVITYLAIVVIAVIFSISMRV